MSEHVHDCPSDGCNQYTVCDDDGCGLDQQTMCFTCANRTLMRERSQFQAEQEGWGVGMMALSLTLGSPKDGVIEAVKRLVAERDRLRELLLTG